MVTTERVPGPARRFFVAVEDPMEKVKHLTCHEFTHGASEAQSARGRWRVISTKPSGNVSSHGGRSMLS